MTEKNRPEISPVRVLCAANASYAPALCVMLTSLAINLAKERELEIYVIATSIPDEDRRKIETSICRNRLNFAVDSLHWLTPGFETIEKLHVSLWGDIEVFARLLAPAVLPKEFDRVLYLDADMVVLADVSLLYDMPLRGSVHAVLDEAVGFVSEPLGVFNYAELGIPTKNPYFNSGVMLMNLPHWRKNNVAGRVMDYLRQHGDKVVCWDQGGLNAILYDSWVEIDPRWNQMRAILELERWRQLGRSRAEWCRTKNHPKIVHYTTEEKPWLGYHRPRYSYFFNYLDKTDYRGVYKGPWLERLIGFRLNYLLWRLKVVLLWKRSPGDLLRVARRIFLPKSNSNLQA